MHEPTYREALRQSWLLTWNHKILWIYGLLALLLGPIGLNDFLGHLWRQSSGVFWPNWMLMLKITDLSTAVGIIWVGGIILSVGLLFLLAGVISQGALIQASAGWYQKNKIEKTDKLWNAGVRNFWPLFLANLTRYALLFIVLIAFGFLWVGLTPNMTFLNSLLVIITITMELFLAMVIYSIFIYTAGYIVIDKKDFLSALKKGAKLFSQHLLVSLELGILIMILNLGLILALLALSTIFLLPSLIIWILANFTGYYGLINIGAISGYIIFILLIAFAGAIFNAFAISSWTYLFIKMHKEGIASRLFHYFGKIFKK